MAHDVFISYSSKDKPVADGICVNLEAAGVRCWIAPRDIAPGEDWPTAITLAISQSRVMVLVFSAHSNSSKDVSRELFLAANSKLVIIPFKIENIEPEPGKQYYMARTHWLEALNPPTQEQIRALIDCVKTLLPVRELPPMETVPSQRLFPIPEASPRAKSHQIRIRRLQAPQDTQLSKVGQGSLRGKYRISIARPKLLSKRYSALFLVQIYLPEMRFKVSQILTRKFKQEPVEHIEESELEMGQAVRLKFSSPEIIFSDSVVMKLNKDINTTNFLAKPDDSCHPGVHQVILSISDYKTQVEYQSITFTVNVSDFAFDHISRPFLSRAFSFAIGAGSLTMFILTLLGQIDTTFGLASGTVAGVLASGIFIRFISMYQQPKILNAP